jgi:cardiolipin synthase
MWEVISGDTADYDKYRPKLTEEEKSAPKQGYVIPYADSPLDGESVGRFVYMDIINSATDYLYITTPYLIPDNETIVALEIAVKSGVDVRIIVPKIPDKKYVYYITQSYCEDLSRMGVKIYEYTPGFIHAKTFLSDDKRAVVGTINLDYRSLYLHFECGQFMQETACIGDIKADFEDMFENKCRYMTTEEIESRSFKSRFLAVILRIFAPLL